MMPKMDGYNVCRMLKFDPKFKSIPIMILTAKSNEKDQAIGKEIAADAYMLKPFDTMELREEVKRLLKVS